MKQFHISELNNIVQQLRYTIMLINHSYNIKRKN
jgi:hypothetical protein